MSETITSEQPPVIVTSPTTEGDKPLESQLAHELEAATARRESKLKVAPVKPPEKPAAQAQSEGNPELRKSRDEAIAKIKAHEGTLKERETTIAELQTQLGEFEGTRKERDALKAKIEGLEKEQAKWQNTESVAVLEASEPYQTKYIEGIGKRVDRLKELAASADIDPAELMSALNKTGKDHAQAMESILSTAGRYLGDEIRDQVREIQRLESDRVAELGNAAELMKQRREQRETETRAQREEKARIRQQAWDATAPKLAKELGLSDEQLSLAKETYDKNKDAGKAAQIILRDQAFDSVLKERDELREELKKLQDATPGIRAGASEQPNGKRDAKAARAELVREFEEVTGRR